MTPLPPERRRHFEAVGALLLANLFWALSFPLIKAVSAVHAAADPAAGGWFISCMTVAPRFLLGAAAVTLWVWWRQRRRPGEGGKATRQEIRQGIALGGFAAGGMLFQNDGLQHTLASTSAFLSQLYAILIPVLVAVHLRRWPTPTLAVSVLMVLVGGGVLAGFDPTELHLGRGETETLIGSLFFTGQILVLGRKDCAGNRALVVTMVMFLTEALLFCVLTGLLAPDLEAVLTPLRQGPWLLGTLLLTLLCTIGAFTLMNTFQPRITPTEAGLIYCVEPIFGSGLAMFLPAWFSVWAGINYPNETFTPQLVIGGILITAANVLVQLRPPKV
jgi:drug/metabolite transporter (DMT)-like permease